MKNEDLTPMSPKLNFLNKENNEIKSEKNSKKKTPKKENEITTNKNEQSKKDSSHNSSSKSGSSDDSNEISQDKQYNSLIEPNQDDDIKLPDFYEIDFYDYETRNLKEVNEQDKNLIFTSSKRITEIHELINYLDNKKILELDALDFSIEKQLYQHRDVIFYGRAKLSEEDEEGTPSFIKCFNVNNITEMNEIYTELEIYFKLIDSESPEFINKMIAFFYDSQNSCFYTFYEYFKLSLIQEIINFDYKQENNEVEENEEESDTTNNSNEKLMIMSQLLRILILLHSNGIIYRDFSLDYFTYDKTNKLIKIFDFANSFMLPDEIFIGNEEIDNEILTKLKNSLFYDGMTFTPKYVPPELASEAPQYGYSEDIWSFGCLLIELFLDYSKYEDDSINPLLTRIFQGEQFNNNQYDDNGDVVIKDPIPRIPKTITKSLAQIIMKCVEKEIYNRITPDKLIEKCNDFFKEEKYDILKISNKENERIQKLINIYGRLYSSYKEEGIYPNTEFFTKPQGNNTRNLDGTEFKFCNEHKDRIKNLYCYECKEVLCDESFRNEHDGHKYTCLGGINALDGDKVIDFIEDKEKLREKQLEVEKIELDKNYKIIQKFCNTFNSDYEAEKEKIKQTYNEIRKKIKDLHKLQIRHLDESKQNFLDSKFQKIFQESKKIGDYCKIFYTTKNLFLSHLNRFNLSFMNKEIDHSNFLLFKKKWEKFTECTESLKINANELKDKCEGLRIPGKYIFRKELYTENLLKMLKSTESKIHTEKHKFFDYSTSNSLYLTQELLMIIPLTNTIFSYTKNSYKKFKIDFEKHKIKINSFLPGCATLHQGEYFFITGGEVKDEATSSFIYMRINQKVIEESVEMNFTRRFHTMMSLLTDKKSYILVIGGWDSKEVEMIETTDNIFNKWLILPSMHKNRSDASTFFYNKKYIYVFGGWDYSTKKSVTEIERYELFNGENIKLTKQWERVRVKGEQSLLQKYNMGIIDLRIKKREQNKEILLVGGYDESFDYSRDVLKIEIVNKENFVILTKEDEGLPPGGESSFWYEKNFHYMINDLDKDEIAVNFNCFNNFYFYSFKNKTFKQYANSTTKV